MNSVEWSGVETGVDWIGLLDWITGLDYWTGVEYWTETVCMAWTNYKFLRDLHSTVHL